MTGMLNFRGTLAAAVPLVLLASCIGTVHAQTGMGGPDTGPDLTDNDFRGEQSVRSMFKDADFTLGFEREIPSPGGSLQLGTRGENPVLAALTVGFEQVIYNLDACGVVRPHAHPRGDEIVFAASGTLDVGFTDEAGSLIRNAELQQGTSFVFPQGYIHYLVNPTCEPAQALATFTSADAGSFNVLPSTLQLPPNVLQAFLPTLNNGAIDRFTAAIEAAGSIAVDEACAARCAAAQGSKESWQE